MGMWEADCRHGPGLLVTLDGIYNQGTFKDNKLMVCTGGQVFAINEVKYKSLYLSVNVIGAEY